MAHIRAQGLDSSRPRSPDFGDVKRAIRRMGVLQIDSVNVVARAHQLTLFSRLGPFDTDLLWRALVERDIFEYWTHMASFVPMEDYPQWKHRMEATDQGGGWKAIRRLREEAPGYIEAVEDEVREHGPLTTSDLDDPGERKGPWWGWADGKHALEFLFMAGRVTVSHRTNFTRHYDDVRRVIPQEVRELDAVPEEEAFRTLLLRSARKIGVATYKDLADYYRLNMIRTATVKPRRVVEDLVAEGALVEVEVEGAKGPYYLHPDATIPRSVSARALVNPFDPIVWHRERTEQIYDFHYRIEIYVPEPKRVHGYYVFPFLLGDELVGRVDLKADRKRGVLTVPGAFLEAGQDPERVASEMSQELHEMARWLGLDGIEVGRRGDLASTLRSFV